MSTIAVVGATGNLGGLTVDALLRRGAEPRTILAAGRNPDRLVDLATRGVRVARIDLDDPRTLEGVFRGVERVLLVSVPGNPRRVAQHRAAVAAAEADGVAFLAYTSFAHADTSSVAVAPDHKATEQVLRESRLSHAILRCGPYYESRTDRIPAWRTAGQIVGAAGAGRMSAASRADLADAAAAVLTSPGHNGAVYELGGDDPFTMSELAEELSRQTGEAIAYVDVTVDELRRALVEAGIPEGTAIVLADADRAVAAGEMLVDTGDLRHLIGRRPTTLSEAIAAALDRQG